MNAAMAYGYRDTGIIRGVCARIADRAGVPVWMPRTAFVIFGVLHWILALIAYFLMARYMCAKRGLSRMDPAPMATPQPSVRDRFSALDARLADLEAATLQQESSLRRAFRDLERG